MEGMFSELLEQAGNWPWVAIGETLRVDLLARLVLASVLGALIGLEREVHYKPAGLRTNVLICLGSALFTLIGMEVSRSAGFGADPTRVMAQVVTGIGFVGAGSILHSRGNVIGLTTAATIWMVAAIGMAAGAGLYLPAIGGTVLTLVVLAALGWVATEYHERRPNPDEQRPDAEFYPPERRTESDDA